MKISMTIGLITVAAGLLASMRGAIASPAAIAAELEPVFRQALGW
jgi:hypothetical protein